MNPAIGHIAPNYICIDSMYYQRQVACQQSDCTEKDKARNKKAHTKRTLKAQANRKQRNPYNVKVYLK